MMKKILITLFVGAAVAAHAQTPKKTEPASKLPPSAPKTPADEVSKMIQLKMPDEVIINSVRSNKLKFTMDDLIKFQTTGASPALLTALSKDDGAPVVPGEPKKPENTVTIPPPVAAAGSYYTDLGALRCEAPRETRKRVLAVADFDFGAYKSKDQAVFNTEVAVGKGMAALAVKRITEAGRFRVVERAALDKLQREIDGGSSTGVKAGTQARGGRWLGADAYVLGTIAVFGPDDKQKGIGAWLGRLWGPLARFGVTFKTNKFVVVVNLRVADTETSEIISQSEARGEAERKGKGVDVGAILGSGAGGGNLDMTSSNFLETLVGEATMKAMDALISKLNETEPKIPIHFIEATSRIADIEGAKLTVSAGSSNGVVSCDRFVVSRIVKVIEDPVTKAILDLQVRKIGEMVVTDVKDKVASGFFQGTEAPKLNDVVEKLKPPKPETPTETQQAAK